jgi:arylsulfatase A-like enzyme
MAGCSTWAIDRPETLAWKAGPAPNGRWRGGKQHIYERGFRVPLIARWPGKVPVGTACDAMVSLVDLLAMMAAIVGRALPRAPEGAEDSHSFLPALLGRAGTSPCEAMIPNSNAGVFAIRKGPWKWLEGVPAGGIPSPLRRAHAAEFRSRRDEGCEHRTSRGGAGAGRPARGTA